MRSIQPILWVALFFLCQGTIAEAATPIMRAVVESSETPTGLTVLDQRGHWWLVEGTDAELARWPEAMVIPTPAPAAAQGLRTWQTLTIADPLIQDLVDQVQWPGLIATVNDIVGWGNRHSYHDNIDVVADSLAARFENLGLTTEKHPFEIGGYTRFNVIATQTGSVHPDSVYVICAHYDATSETPQQATPGADDNASGVTGVLTCARLLSGLDTAYSVKYVLFAGEEQFMVGSEAWVSEMAASNLAIVGAMNADMIGWWQEGVPFDLEIETNSHSRWMADAIVNAADLYTDMDYVLHQDDDAWWGDFYRFWQYGYAAVNHEESWDWGNPDFNPDYHTTGDLPANLSEPFMTGCVKVLVAGLAQLVQVNQVSAVESQVVPMGEIQVSAAPNPFNGQTLLSFALDGGSGRHVVEIYDLAGRCVGRESVMMAAGRGQLNWSATGLQGQPLGSGVYLARVTGPQGEGNCRLAYVK